ncbi:hypothetical protein BDR03DRAFT_938388 [Suillus americanus]|nr:hypothetical protein BDR03DRAFT_938388 [Suillus americanus]
MVNSKDCVFLEDVGRRIQSLHIETRHEVCIDYMALLKPMRTTSPKYLHASLALLLLSSFIYKGLSLLAHPQQRCTTEQRKCITPRQTVKTVFLNRSCKGSFPYPNHDILERRESFLAAMASKEQLFKPPISARKC